MPIVISDHAKKKLKSRGISQKLALETVKKSQEILPSFKTRRLRQKRFGDKILRVITTTEGSKITIITGYYVRRKKYEN
ncbi:DUF4258 domain-containing protein [Candidatus Curtissbacteria bacterium]|nr:DUF4258 domain-containing protein [Candidatus Curtissbacteria bacterium]